MNASLPDARESREDKVRRFRQMYLAGTLDRVLIPADADFSRLLADVLGERAPSRR